MINASRLNTLATTWERSFVRTGSRASVCGREALQLLEPVLDDVDRAWLPPAYGFDHQETLTVKETSYPAAPTAVDPLENCPLKSTLGFPARNAGCVVMLTAMTGRPLDRTALVRSGAQTGSTPPPSEICHFI